MLNRTQFSAALAEVPRSQWPHDDDPRRLKVLVSQSYLVQLFKEADGVVRLSVNRVQRAGPSWGDGITWDELMLVKREAGFGDWWAVEIYPEDNSVVNVANMRHLWVLPEPPNFGWRK